MLKVLYPLRYFRLKNEEKRFIDLWPTLAISVVLVLPFLIFDRANFFGVGGFLTNLISLTGALTGFYVAALVAAATFAHPDLDKTIRSGPVALVTRDSDGRKVSEALTRREFACYVFGFLSFSAMAFTIYAAAAIPAAQAVPKTVVVNGTDIRWLLAAGAKVLTVVWISHLFVVSSLGLYYLMDRLYRRDRQIVTPKAKRSDVA